MKKHPEHSQSDEQKELADSLIKLRQHIHQFPELSYNEEQTAKLVATKLEEWGFKVTTGIGGHGVVGTLTVGNGAKSVAIRADMDALPIQETTALPYQSQHDGVMHACGHDGHTTMLLGAAWQLSKTRRFSGTVHLIFQPAEETGFNSGAERMIADGLFERFHCDAIFGLHNHPGIKTGSFLFRAGPFMSASATVTVIIHGKGGHAGRPQMTADPVVAASSLVMGLQTVVSRNIDPTQTAVVTVGSLQAGQIANVIPNSATLKLSIRSFRPEDHKLIEERIRTLVHHHASAYNCQAEINWHGGYPAVINSENETELARKVAEDLVGPENVIAPFPAITGSEDFAYFLQQKPGCFLRLGNGNSEMLHHPNYNFDDNNIITGATYWTKLVERYLSEN